MAKYRSIKKVSDLLEYAQLLKDGHGKYRQNAEWMREGLDHFIDTEGGIVTLEESWDAWVARTAIEAGVLDA